MSINRRNFLKLIAGAGAAGAVGLPKSGHAVEDFEGWPDTYGVLVDTSLCIGCRACEAACNQANQLPTPPQSFEDQKVFETVRRPDAGAFTVVNRYQNETTNGQPVFVKKQCMHCNEPACFSACLVKAFTKTPEGAVVYNPDICIGCRYCMQACPFYMPGYEYNSAFAPRVRKCTLCYDRISKTGGVPACVEACPQETLVFGKRKALIKLANRRLLSDSKYISHIYGEREVGGTSWMYISKVPFETLGFNMKMGVTPIPKYSYGFLWTVPLVLTIWPALLGGIYSITKRSDDLAKEAEKKTGSATAQPQLKVVGTAERSK